MQNQPEKESKIEILFEAPAKYLEEGIEFVEKEEKIPTEPLTIRFEEDDMKWMRHYKEAYGTNIQNFVNSAVKDKIFKTKELIKLNEDKYVIPR